MSMKLSLTARLGKRCRRSKKGHAAKSPRSRRNPAYSPALLKCPECGGNLNFHFNQNNHDIKFFSCQNHNSGYRKCSKTHYIRLDFLEQVVLYEVKRLACFASEYENDFIKAMIGRSAKVAENTALRKQRELDALTARDRELDMLFERLYEDNVLGRVTDEQYRMLSGDYTDEQRMLEEQIPQKEQRLAQLQAREANVDAFIEKAKQYTAIDTLTPELLRLFIQRIEVGERETKYSRNSSQSVRIIYRDIGTLDSAMQPDEKQPKLLPPLSEIIPFPA